MAHTYATDSPERKYIPLFLAAAAIGAAFLTFQLLKNNHIDAPWWIGPPDTMVFYGLFYVIFDQLIWKLPPLRWFGITKVPNLSGRWHGKAEPAPTPGISQGLTAAKDITLTIRQTWSELRVTAQTEQSKSESLSGVIVVADEVSMGYEFRNEPSAPAPLTMQAHRGFARLTLNAAQTVLEGEYFSGRGRQTIGTIRVTRSNN
jgi:hypothetical protein